MAGKKQPAILDKNKLKLILDNLRNDKPTGSKGQARPRYLNTIESEGNLPASQFHNRGQNHQSIVSKASNNQLSRRSIHSLDSLRSEGSQSQHEQDRHYNLQKANNLDQHAHFSGRLSGEASSSYQHRQQQDNEILSIQHYQERSQNVPMHTGDNGSQASHENHEDDYGGASLQPPQQQVFSYEKQHRTRGLDNVDVQMVQQNNGPVDLTSRDPKIGRR